MELQLYIDELRPLVDIDCGTTTLDGVAHVAGLMRQKYLDMGTGILRTVQTRRNNVGIVKHQHIAGLKIIYQIIKMLMLNFAGLFVNNQQTRMVARLHRMLSNQLLWQLIIKISY